MITPTAPPQFGDIQLFSAQSRLGRVRYIGYSVGLGMLVNGAMLLMGGIGVLLEGGSEVFGMTAADTLIVLVLLALIVSILLSIQILLASIPPLIFVTGIVVALAIPAYQQFHHRADRLQAPARS